jgi:uncharacterized phage-like protein YoqJ
MSKGYTYTPPKSATSKPKKVKSASPTFLSEDKYIIWHIQGGLGKNVAGSALCKDLKEKYPDRKLIMVTSWPEIYLNNPDVDRIYQLGQTPHFYEDYVEGKDVIIFKHEPYEQTGHITKQKHLIENWCDLLDIKYKEQKPVLIPNYSQKVLTSGVWKRNKPTMVLQTCGGPMDGNHHGYAWTRDMPPEIARAIVAKYSQQYHILQVTRPSGYPLDGVERVEQKLSNTELFSMLVGAEKRIVIDSCLQHASAALDLKSTVLWIGTSPKVFGYNIHTNIVAKLPKKANQMIGSYLFDFQFENNLHECPYLEVQDIFDVNEILNSI